MNLYLFERTDSVGYDEYDADVVAAKDEDSARELSHVGRYRDVIVTLVGTSASDKERVILASFNAG